MLHRIAPGGGDLLYIRLSLWGVDQRAEVRHTLSICCCVTVISKTVCVSSLIMSILDIPFTIFTFCLHSATAYAYQYDTLCGSGVEAHSNCKKTCCTGHTIQIWCSLHPLSVLELEPELLKPTTSHHFLPVILTIDTAICWALRQLTRLRMTRSGWIFCFLAAPAPPCPIPTHPRNFKLLLSLFHRSGA